MTDSVNVQVASSGDTLLDSSFPTSNNGSLVFWGVNTSFFVSLIKFDLSSIPANATITNAKLLLTCRSGTASITAQIHRILRPWTEGGATWNKYDGTFDWATAGAKNTIIDYDDTLLGTLTWTSIDAQIEVPVLSEIVQSWVNGSDPNYGFRITPVSSTTLTFHSEESVTPSFRPLFEIDYTTPIAYEVNSTAINAGIQADWKRIATGNNANATQKLSTNWRRHTWFCEFMEMTEWLVLLALRGTSFTELKTTNESAPNSTATYATGRVMSVTGNQVGRRMAKVRVEFLVDVTS